MQGATVEADDSLPGLDTGEVSRGGPSRVRYLVVGVVSLPRWSTRDAIDVYSPQ